MCVLYVITRDVNRVYFGTDTRAFALLMGAVLSLWWTRDAGSSPSRSRLIGRVGAVGSVALVVLVATRGDTWNRYNEGGFFVVALASTAVVMACVRPGTALRRALAWRPLRAVGQISYGLYVWHWPIFVWISAAHFDLHGGSLLATRFAAAFGAAITSYFLLERPIRRHGLGLLMARIASRRRRVVLGGALVATCAATSAALVIVATASVPSGLASDAPALARERSLHPHDPVIMLRGDSVLETLALAPPSAPLQGAVWESRPVIGCGIMSGSVASVDHTGTSVCAQWPAQWRADVTAADPDLVVVELGPWETVDRFIAGHVVRAGSPAYRAVLLTQLRRAVNILSARGAAVDFLEVPCAGVPGDTPDAVSRRDPRNVAAVNESLAELAVEFPRTVKVVSWTKLVCPDGRYAQVVDGVIMRPDGDHYGAAGSHRWWATLAPVLRADAVSARAARRAATAGAP